MPVWNRVKLVYSGLLGSRLCPYRQYLAITPGHSFRALMHCRARMAHLSSLLLEKRPLSCRTFAIIHEWEIVTNSLLRTSL
jgi:hypothetical protein